MKVLENYRERAERCVWACAETGIPSVTDVIAKASNNVINNVDFTLATKKTRRNHHEA